MRPDEQNGRLLWRVFAFWGRRRRYADRRQRRLARIAALGCCAYCGRWTWDSDADVDHVYPWARGGQTLWPFNLVWACTTCNTEKGVRTPQEAWPHRRIRRRGWPRP